jgi:hypothetical protein
MEDRLAVVIGLLGEVTEEDERWVAAVTESSNLEDDLKLESFEVTALGERLRVRFGDHVDLMGYLARLDIDELIALTVGDVVAFVEQALVEQAPVEQAR